MLSSAINQLCRQCRQQFVSLPMRCSPAVINGLSQAHAERRSWLLYAPVRSAGHSHWQNIRNIKATKDDQRQKIINDVLRRMRVAVREGGGTDPNINRQLARALEDGKSKDVPNTTMFEALRKMEKSKDIKGSVLYVEGKALMNCCVIVEMYTDRPKRARQQVQHILKKFGGSIGESGTAKPCFNFKGVVYVTNEGNQSMTKDEALEKAIEAGAEEVIDCLDDEDRPAFKFVCDPKELHVVKNALDDGGVETGPARLEFIPHTLALLEGAALDLAADMREALSTSDEVVRVYDNVGAADPDT